MLRLRFCFLLLIGSCFSVFAQDDKPSKEEVLRSIMDIDVSEEEAIELLAKYYPELLNPVVEAKKDFEKANAIQDSEEAGQYYQNIGRKFLEKQAYDEAIIYFQKAILLKKQAEGGSEKHPDISNSYLNLGKAYEGKKDTAAALQSFQRGLISNAGDFDEADFLKNPKATDVLSNTLAIPIFESKGNLLMHSENNESRLLAALIAYERAIEIAGLACEKYTSEYSKLQLSQEITRLSEKSIQVALKLHQLTRNPQYKVRIFKIIEKGKAMILTSSLLQSKARALSKIPPYLLQKEEDLKVKIAQLNQKIKTQKSDQKSIQQNDKKRFALTQALFFLEDSLKTYYPQEGYLQYQNSSIALDSLQTFLGQRNAAVIEYFFGETTAFVFTITANELQVEKLNNTKSLISAILELRADIQTQVFKSDANRALQTYVSKAQQIYSLALEKALGHVDQGTQELFIIPDGALWLMPFEILLYEPVNNPALNFSPEQLPYLINKYAISYANSSRLLLHTHIRQRSEGAIPFLGFAPEFDGEALASRSCLSKTAILAQLGFNQSELESISSLFAGQIHLGPQATRKNFETFASDADILHLSTHACLNKEDPMDSRIFFAEQQYLTTKDVYNLDIKARMAVLSACETGLGQIYNGEGVISLARAFAQAGCPSVTMSLWPVADEATAQVMVSYYKNLDRGIHKGEALRQAKLTYLKEQPKAKQHPYYWAAFVHLGDDSPIRSEGSGSRMFWYFVLAGVLILAVVLFKRR